MSSGNKSMPDTRQWEKLRREILKRTAISLRELGELVETHVKVGVDYAARRLCQEGLLKRAQTPRRGLYLVADNASTDDFIRKPLEAIQTKYGCTVYFCYGTALYLHGLSRYGRVVDYYIGTAQSRNKIKMGQIWLHFAKTPVDETTGVMEVNIAKQQVRVTDFERTFLDCIHRPKYAQGWDNVLHAINKIDNLREDRIYDYLKRYRLPSLVAKTCVMLEHFTTKWQISDSMFNRLRAYLPKSPVSFFRNRTGVLNKRWNVYVPNDLFEG